MSLRKTHVIVTCLAAVLLLGGILVVDGCNVRSTTDLITDLKSDQEKDRINAVRTLRVENEDAEKVVPALIESLKDQQGDIRLSAAIKLGKYGELAREAIPALKVAALHDRDARVRRAAVNALAKIEPNSASKNPSDQTTAP